jgi:histone deacetylase 1/2
MKPVYFYDTDIGNYYYGCNHPMKPHRIRMTHSLLQSYNVLPCLEYIANPVLPSVEDHFSKFHTDDYVDFLKQVTPENVNDYIDLVVGFNLGEDCPVFEGMYDFCKKYTTASIIAATYINEGRAQYAINWSGGLHHAKEQEASGFCYINDCVLSILELLRTHQRVCYIDIDIHHGDGVEEAFYTTDRVMFVSFHKFGNYFPDTGYFTDAGYGKGDGYSLNFPLFEGMDDESFEYVFKPVLSEIMNCYQPTAIVLQCGTDSLSGDRLGCFNLSVKGHGSCVEYVKSFGIPMLCLGGGGYTLRNVARGWAYETSILAGVELPNEIPEEDEYRGYYGPEYKLNASISNMENMNSKEYLRRNIEVLVSNIRQKVHAVAPTLSNYTLHPFSNTVNPLFSREGQAATLEVSQDANPDVRV